MKSITIRDLRLHWPETEKALRYEGEILVTRDGQPVARLLPPTKPRPRRKRWNPQEHEERIRKILGNKIYPSYDEHLAEERADRKL